MRNCASTPVSFCFFKERIDRRDSAESLILVHVHLYHESYAKDPHINGMSGAKGGEEDRSLILPSKFLILFDIFDSLIGVIRNRYTCNYTLDD